MGPRAGGLSLGCLVLTSIVTHPAAAREVCPGGSDPRGEIVALDGSVFAEDEAGQHIPLSVGTELCPLDRIITGSRSRVEFRLAGKNTTTGSSSNSVTIIPGRESECLEIRSGIISFLSSVIGTHCIRTPLIDGGIDGTEGLVAVEAETGASFFMVREGVVVVSDRRAADPASASLALEAAPGRSQPAAFATPSQRLTIATPENVPAAFRELLLRPENATDWAVYFPPILLAAGVDDPRVLQAAQLLDSGEPRAADAMLAGLDLSGRAEAAALSLRAMIAVALNRTDEAGSLADAAVNVGQGLGAALVAQSYARQSRGELRAARASAQAAVEADPGDAFAWARLAELDLTIGDVRAARDAADRSLVLADTALGHAMIGFTDLASGRFGDAGAAFRRAIAIDSEAPLPRLGLGLAAIRQGRAAEGRLEIETAVSLDPRRASFRTWLGRAYFEERDPGKAANQFALAAAEDPDDPNAYLFSALVLYGQNRPIEALGQVEQARAAAPGRAVLRTEAGLGEDLAVTTSALGRIYDVLGFERLLEVTAGEAVDRDARNPEAHRLLADAARTDPDAEITQVSEFLKARILSPPSKAPLQPQLGEIDLGLLETTGAARVTFAEFSSLFDGNGLAGYGSGFGGTQETFGYEAAVSGLHDNASFALGAFHYDTEGYGFNNDLMHQIYAAEIKYRPAPEFTLFAEIGRRDTRGGDRRIDLTPNRPRSDNLRVSLQNDYVRFGGSFEPNDRLTVIGYSEFADQDSSFREAVMDLATSFESEQHGFKIEGLALLDLEPLDLQFGAEYARAEIDETTNLSIPGLAFPTIIGGGPVDFYRVHGSAELEVAKGFTWTAGLAWERLEQDGIGTTPAFVIEELQPKVGVRIEPLDGVVLRGAYTESLVRPSIFPETLERTTYASFGQFFDDAPGTEYRSLSGGIDLGPFHGVRAGAAVESLEIDIPNLGLRAAQAESVTVGGYVAAPIGDKFAVSVEPKWEMTESNVFLAPSELDTVIVPLTGSFFHPSGFFASATVNYYEQDGVDAGLDFSDRGFVTNAAIGFRLPRERGVITVEALNLFDKDVELGSRDATLTPQNFGDVLLNTPIFAPDITVMATLTLRH